MLSAGHHEVTIAIRDAGALDSLAVHEFAAAFEVADAGPPPPPPPPPGPIDSLIATRPNPFARATHFGVMVNGPTRLEVGIWDVQGRRVRRIFEGPVAAGTSSYAWDGNRDDGSRANAGVYFYRVIQPGRVFSRPVVLLPRP